MTTLQLYTERLLSICTGRRKLVLTFKFLVQNLSSHTARTASSSTRYFGYCSSSSSINKMEQFLLDCKKNFLNRPQNAPVHVVMGNEACDLDSAISSLAYAYYLNKTSNAKDFLAVPLFNIASQQYPLRTEVTHLLEQFNIKPYQLFFKGNIDLKSLHSLEMLSITLVDHNVLTGADVEFEDAVKEVIDHHVKERPDDENVTIKHDLVGSCSTLIAEELLANNEFTMEVDIATMLYCTILVDTINRSEAAGKITRRDSEVLNQLQSLLPDIDGDLMYAGIMKAKFDINHLTNTEIFQKDLKIVDGSEGKVAMSSVTMEIDKLLSRDNFIADLKAFLKTEEADGSIIMTMIEMDGVPTRHIAVYSPNKELKNNLIATLSASEIVDLQLVPCSASSTSLFVRQQGNVKASRKQVMPVVKKFLTNKCNHVNQ